MLVMTGRAISGYGVGVGMPATAIYIAEVSSPQMRGKLSSLPALLMALGVLLGYLLGGWRDCNKSPSHVQVCTVQSWCWRGTTWPWCQLARGWWWLPWSSCQSPRPT